MCTRKNDGLVNKILSNELAFFFQNWTRIKNKLYLYVLRLKQNIKTILHSSI